MKRNSTSTKAQSHNQKQWNDRPSVKTKDQSSKLKYEYKTRDSSINNNYKFKESSVKRYDPISNANPRLKSDFTSPAFLSMKLKDEPKYSGNNAHDLNARTSSYRASVKRKNTNDNFSAEYSDNLTNAQNMTSLKRGVREHENSGTLKNDKKSINEERIKNDLMKKHKHDYEDYSFPKVNERVSKSIQNAKNSNFVMNNGLKELESHSVHLLQGYSTGQSFASNSSSEYSYLNTFQQTRNVVSLKNKQKTDVIKSQSVERKSIISEPTQPILSLNNGVSSKTITLSPARSSSFLFNGVEAYYSVNTTNGTIRTYNEDRVSIVINIKRKSDWTQKAWPNCSYFSIFDGHGGALCADFLKDNLHKMILENPNFPENPKIAIEQGCAQAEHDFCKFALKQTNIERSGSCGVILLVIDEKIYIGNVGDSRAIVSEMNGKFTSNLTNDHKPEELGEKERIERNGGKVMKNSYLETYKFLMPMINNRLNELPFRLYPGGLSVSRSFGDITAKDVQLGGNPNVLIARPDIYVYSVKKTTDFIFVGCEFIRRWDF